MADDPPKRSRFLISFESYVSDSLLISTRAVSPACATARIDSNLRYLVKLLFF